MLKRAVVAEPAVGAGPDSREAPEGEGSGGAERSSITSIKLQSLRFTAAGRAEPAAVMNDDKIAAPSFDELDGKAAMPAPAPTMGLHRQVRQVHSTVVNFDRPAAFTCPCAKRLPSNKLDFSTWEIVGSWRLCMRSLAPSQILVYISPFLQHLHCIHAITYFSKPHTYHTHTTHKV